MQDVATCPFRDAFGQLCEFVANLPGAISALSAIAVMLTELLSPNGLAVARE